MLLEGSAGQTVDSDHSKPGSKPTHKVSKKERFQVTNNRREKTAMQVPSSSGLQIGPASRGRGGDKDKIFNLVSNQKFKFIEQ